MWWSCKLRRELQAGTAQRHPFAGEDRIAVSGLRAPFAENVVEETLEAPPRRLIGLCER